MKQFYISEACSNNQQNLCLPMKQISDASVREQSAKGSCNSHEEPYTMNFSQDESMSYTQMLLGHERTPDYYNDFIQGPMGAETSCDKHSKEKPNNMAPELHDSDDDIEEAAPHYDIFGEDLPNARTYKFFNEYASICGFSIAKAGNYHGRKGGNTGHTRVTFVCNRAGKPETKFLRSHKSMTEDGQLFIRAFASVKLPPRKIMSILSYLRGGDIPYTKKHVSNVQTAIRNECKLNDMTQVLDYFRKRKEDDPRFYYNFKLGEGNKVLSLFWSDGNSRRMYELYGDCVSFDTTYKTNRYNLPFASFVGVTGHGHTCLFACAIIQNETAECFTWLFQEFLHCMGNKSPKTIITEQCVSMATSIPQVFPKTVHRNCFFHIRKKCDEKCGRSFATKGKNRAKFVPVYFKKDFFPFLHSTARSEGTNSVFKDNVGSTYSVISFLGEYERITKEIEEKEREQDSITRTTTPDYWVKSEIEYQAGRIYEVYKTRMLAEKDFRSRRFVVLVNLPTEDFSCICCKFQKDGILCSHILRVLVNLNISELPAKYFIERWKPQDRKVVRDKQYNVPLELTEKNRHLMFTLLTKRLVDIASEGSRDNERYLLVVKEAIQIEAKLDAISAAQEEADKQKNNGNQTENVRPDVVDDGFGATFENPDVAKPRGRPTVTGRQKTLVEEFRSKQRITCSHCGSHAHNIAAPNSSKKRQNTGKSKMQESPLVL
ncbi:protein FAR1-RELATED SEQUENCE 5-like [Lolium perenne]|uniref:protein FAR1-RELATED SEQUENCE 5-like n=1 Tax=Lolium perenne TaxID=4522 RepID=UPI0021F61F92|nr:protein FAR1-RELATED SEQUENCE 5-like [Lolium perenne]